MSIDSLSGGPYQLGTANQTIQNATAAPLGSGNGNDPPKTVNAAGTDTVIISPEAIALYEAEESAPVQPLGNGSGNDPPKPPNNIE